MTRRYCRYCRTWAEIAKITGLSRGQLYRLHASAICKLRKNPVLRQLAVELSAGRIDAKPGRERHDA